MDVLQSIKGTVIVNIKLKEARTKADLTQLEVAEKANVQVRAYQRYEADERVPNARIAKLIARALDSTVEELF